MKILAAIPLFFILSIQNKCNKTNKTDTIYKGRLETKGMCMNYTITLLEGHLDTSRISATWTNESTGKTYQNAFALGSVCDFPSTLNEGDEFYFEIFENAKQDCAVCMAYYPKPPKALLIKVVNK